MSDDIVTRLREVAVQEYKDGWAVFPVCDRAAKEIERLRADLYRWIKIARREHRAWCQHKSEEECREYLDELYLAMEADGFGE